MSNSDQRDGLSVRAMVIGIIVLLIWLCWALAASAYFGSQFEGVGDRGRGLAFLVASVLSFLFNSLRIHHSPAVISHTLQHQRWILLMFLLSMGAALLFGLWVKKLEAELAGPKCRNRRKRK